MSRDHSPESSRGSAADRPPRSEELSDISPDAKSAPTAPGSAPAADDSGSVGAYDTVQPATVASPDQHARWPEGTLIAERFRVKKFIGKGGMGTVYLAHDEMLGRPVALKRIPPEILFDGDARDDLRQEANRLLDLAHENIVRIHTYYDSPGYGDTTWPFIAMEYLQGPTLKTLLRERRRYGRGFNEAEVLVIARQVARGLSHAHSKGVVHRDLKPANLMLAEPPEGPLTDRDLVKITDFGVSRVVADSTLRHTGKRSGTLPYMSPEQFRGESSTRQSDIYSFGCTLYELLLGSPPFTTGDVAYQIVHIDPRFSDQISRPVAQALRKALAKDPRDRFDSVEDFVEALEGRRRVWLPPLGRKSRFAWDAARVGAPLALLFLLVWTFFGVGDPGATARRDSTPGASGAILTRRVESPQRLEAFRQAKEAFKRLVRGQLSAQIPSRLGRKHARPDGTAAQIFEIRRPSSPNDLEQHLFDGLLFQCRSTRPPVQTLRGSRQGDRLLFELRDLVTGSYTLTASVLGLDGKPTELDAYTFEVDLVPPVLEVRPLDASVLVDTESAGESGGSVRYLTFSPNVDVQPLASEPEEVLAETSYRIAGVGDTWRRLEGPYLRVVLPGRGEVTYEFRAEDLAANGSEPVQVVFRRLHLELASFGLASPDGVIGNLATVRGVIRIEGQHRPVLKFFVNETLTATEGDGADTGGALPPWEELVEQRDGAEIVSVPFSARLRLPRAEHNTIEVRYSWNDREPVPFDRAIRIPRVDVVNPKISLLQRVDRTSETRLTLRGSVEPSFDGLEILIEVAGKGGSIVELSPTGLGSSATFQHELQLWPGGENAVRFVSFYRGDPLAGGESNGFSVHCDTELPGLAQPVEFEVVDDRLLYVTIYPTEALQQLRIKATSDEDPISSFQIVERLPRSSAYRFIARRPEVPTDYQIEMTDLVGLQELVSAKFEPQSVEIAAFGNPPSPTGASAVERSSRSGVDPRSPFLRAMGVEFLPFGFSRDRLEMSETEVPELPWYRFLSEEKGRILASSGSTRRPAVLGEDTPGLLIEFAAWFERNAADGYTYFIPTKAQWLMAFSGASDPQEALAEILEWFRDGRADRKRFDPNPGERYGMNKVGEIGSRRENRTPTGFLDMESNVREIVLDGGIFSVLGGYNRLTEWGMIEDHCLKARPYSQVASSQSGSLTGFRLCRKLAHTE